ncbi:hypothetical protein CTAYLR_004257 [Chrysophaeum taylorii]|uniref:Uncharacterized protein n=1 Tax=Chrysophaeum taylorii TaxID=2483200 RepID=A0AAD7XPC7_9STRA|nr:hypothetical protein CTAYLR_004257 [Chrysophaeum taylorii]
MFLRGGAPGRVHLDYAPVEVSRGTVIAEARKALEAAEGMGNLAGRVEELGMALEAEDVSSQVEESAKATLEEVIAACEAWTSESAVRKYLIRRKYEARFEALSIAIDDRIREVAGRRRCSESRPSLGSSLRFLKSCNMTWRRVLERLETNDRDFCKLDAEDARRLATALETNTALKTLYVWGNKMGDEGAASLAAALEKNASLETLYLWSNRIGDEGASRLAKSLEKNKSLKCLTLSHIVLCHVITFGLRRTMIDVSMKAAILLESTPSDATRGLHERVAKLQAALKHQAVSAEALEVTKRTLDDVNDACGEWSRSSPLKKYINRTAFSARCTELEAALDRRVVEVTSTRVTTRDENPRPASCGKPMPSVGASDKFIKSCKMTWRRILERLERNDRDLTKLELKFCKLGPEDTCRLAVTLEFNTSLKVLYVWGTQIGDAGAGRLADVLEKNTTLEQLYLVSNRIGDKGALRLAAALENNTSLKCLTLSRNKLSQQAKRHLRTVAKKLGEKIVL